MAELKEQITINVKNRPVIRNWLIRVNDIRRALIHRDNDESGIKTFIEIRYNTQDITKENGIEYEILSYDKTEIVYFFYKILNCIKRAKSKKNSDDYLVITESEVYLLSEINIEF